MFKKTLITLFLMLTSLTSLKAQIEIPTQFFVKQHWFSLTNTFDVESKDRKFGTIHRKLFSWMPQYLFYNLNNEIQAVAKMRFLSLGATFDIYDVADQPIGKVDEKILTFFSTFKLYRADGYFAAKAKLNFWGTKYTVTDAETDEVIAYLWRHFFRLKDNWTVDIVNPSLIVERQIDPRMFILVMAFQTDRDYWEGLRYQSNYMTTLPSLSNNYSQELSYHQQNLENYRIVLDTYCEQLGNIIPNEEDFLSIETIADILLENHDEIAENDENSGEYAEVLQARSLDKGISLLLPLLNSTELTFNQRSALFLMLDQLL